MKIKSIILLLTIFGTSCSYSQHISNIYFEQVGKKIHIYYDLVGDESYTVQAFCSIDNGQNWGKHLKNVSGAVGDDQMPGNAKMIVWNVLEEVDDLTGEIKFRIAAEPKFVQVNTRAIYTGTSKNKEGTNQGNTQGAGDMGKPTGDKESDKYDGKGGKGDGISYGLGGRGNLHLDVPPSNFEEVGEIKVTIFVNRVGIVVDARIDYSGTTVLSSEQRKQAIDAAMNSKFEQKSDAPDKDRGWITYSYIK